MKPLSRKPQRSSEFGVRNSESPAFIPHSALRTPHSHVSCRGFTLIEIMLGTSIMVIVLVAMLGSFLGQSTLNQNSRNMMAAMNDATRVMEQIRQQNTGCSIPSAVPPANYTRWDDWLRAQNPGKSIQPSSGSSQDVELVAVTCQDGSGTFSYCGVAATN